MYISQLLGYLSEGVPQRGAKIWTPTFSHTMTPTQFKNTVKSISARKSCGSWFSDISTHTTSNICRSWQVYPPPPIKDLHMKVCAKFQLCKTIFKPTKLCWATTRKNDFVLFGQPVTLVFWGTFRTIWTILVHLYQNTLMLTFQGYLILNF